MIFRYVTKATVKIYVNRKIDKTSEGNYLSTIKTRVFSFDMARILLFTKLHTKYFPVDSKEPYL